MFLFPIEGKAFEWLLKTSVSAKFISALSMAALAALASSAMFTALVRPVVAAMMAASVQNVALICSNWLVCGVVRVLRRFANFGLIFNYNKFRPFSDLLI